jgi:hypothetical protein
MPPRALLAVATGLVATSLAGCVVRVDSDGYREREEKRFTTKSRPTIQLSTFDGAVVIRGWDRDEISVEVEKRGPDKAAVETIDVVSEQKGDDVRVEVREKGAAPKRSYGFGRFTSRSARLIASVPSGSNLIVRTGDGSIKVEHVTGRIELRSSDGSVTGTDLVGDIVAHTEDGAIKLERLDGKCDAASDDGSIEVQGRLDGLRVSTDDGSVVVKALSGSKVGRDWSLTTLDGSMVLYVPDALAADLDAQVDDGTVRLDSSIEFEKANDGRAKNVLRGRLGAGGPRLTMRSGDGNIRLRRLPGDLAALPPRPPHSPLPPHAPPPPPDVPVER